MNATIRHHLMSTDISRESAKKVLRRLYVDDQVGGDDSDDSIFEIFKNLKSSFKTGGFDMLKWVSNSVVLQERIEKSEDQSPQACQIQGKSVENPKILDEDQTLRACP